MEVAIHFMISLAMFLVALLAATMKDKLVKHVWRAQAIKSKEPRLVAFYPTLCYT